MGKCGDSGKAGIWMQRLADGNLSAQDLTGKVQVRGRRLVRLSSTHQRGCAPGCLGWQRKPAQCDRHRRCSRFGWQHEDRWAVFNGSGGDERRQPGLYARSRVTAHGCHRVSRAQMGGSRSGSPRLSPRTWIVATGMGHLNCHPSADDGSLRQQGVGWTSSPRAFLNNGGVPFSIHASDGNVSITTSQ